MIKFILILIFIIFPFGQLTKLPFSSSEISVSLLDLLVAGLVVIWLIGQIGRKKPKVFPRLTKPILFFIGAGIISLLVNSFRLSQRELFVSGLYLIRWVVYAGVYFVVYDLTRFQSFKVSRFKTGLIWDGVLAAIFGLFQYFLYPDLRNLSYLGWDPHKLRAFGTFLDPNFLGIILVLTIILIVFRGKINFINIINFIIVYITLALTYSRASYLAYLIGIGVISLIRKTPRLFWAALIIGLMTILMLPKIEGEGGKLERQYTINSRILNWQQSLSIFKDYPFFGVGFNSYRYAQKDYGFLKEEGSHAGAGADSSLLFVLATTGIVGITAYGYLIYKIYKNHKNYMIWASLTAVIIHSFFNNTLFYPAVMLWIWVLIGSDHGA